MQALQPQMTLFLVLRADGTLSDSTETKDAYYYMAKARAGTANLVDCYPLFAGGTAAPVTINLAAQPIVQTPPAPLRLFPILHRR